MLPPGQKTRGDPVDLAVSGIAPYAQFARKSDASIEQNRATGALCIRTSRAPQPQRRETMAYDDTYAACLDTRARGHAQHVLIQLARHRNSLSGRCNPSTATLAKNTGLKKQTVCNAIATLERLGCITAIRRPGKATNYVLNLQQPVPETAPVDQCRNRHHTSAENGTAPVPKTAPESGSNQERNPKSAAHASPAASAAPYGARSKIPAGQNRNTLHLAPCQWCGGSHPTGTIRQRCINQDLNDTSWATSP